MPCKMKRILRRIRKKYDDIDNLIDEFEELLQEYGINSEDFENKAEELIMIFNGDNSIENNIDEVEKVFLEIIKSKNK